MLFAQALRLAASRAALTAGSSRAIKMPMMAITTSNSMRVKPLRFSKNTDIGHLHQNKKIKTNDRQFAGPNEPAPSPGGFPPAWHAGEQAEAALTPCWPKLRTA